MNQGEEKGIHRLSFLSLKRETSLSRISYLTNSWSLSLTAFGRSPCACVRACVRALAPLFILTLLPLPCCNRQDRENKQVLIPGKKNFLGVYVSRKFRLSPSFCSCVRRTLALEIKHSVQGPNVIYAATCTRESECFEVSSPRNLVRPSLQFRDGYKKGQKEKLLLQGRRGGRAEAAGGLGRASRTACPPPMTNFPLLLSRSG